MTWIASSPCRSMLASGSMWHACLGCSLCGCGTWAKCGRVWRCSKYGVTGHWALHLLGRLSGADSGQLRHLHVCLCQSPWQEQSCSLESQAGMAVAGRDSRACSSMHKTHGHDLGDCAAAAPTLSLDDLLGPGMFTCVTCLQAAHLSEQQHKPHRVLGAGQARATTRNHLARSIRHGRAGRTR